MMYKKGDKFIIEIVEVITCDGSVWYKTNGADPFIIDQRGLDSLEQLVNGVNKVSKRIGFEEGYSIGLSVGESRGIELGARYQDWKDENRKG